jgi:cytochrome c oxidase assembly protein subunit 15
MRTVDPPMADPLMLTPTVPRWLRAWAWLTVAATLVLLALGSFVTTFRVGMADPVWPTEPWYLATYDWKEPNPGFVIEHAHRAAGWTVGVLTIVLAGGLIGNLVRKGRSSFRGGPQAAPVSAAWLAGLGVVALFAVSAQGILGGLRVRLDAWKGPELAAFHGFFAQVVFSLLVAVAVLCGPPRAIDGSEASWRRLYRRAHVLAGLVVVQVLFGVLLRHFDWKSAQRLHFATAFAATAAAVWFLAAAYADPGARRRLGAAVGLLVLLLTAQLLLGIEAWLGKYGTGVMPELQRVTPSQAGIRAAHLLVGTGLMATAVALALQTRRAVGSSVEEPGRDEEPVLAGRPVGGDA